MTVHKVILRIDRMDRAEEILGGSVDVIGPYINSLYSNVPEQFYDELVTILPDVTDTESVYHDKNINRIIKYDIFCNLTDAALRLIEDDIRHGYSSAGLPELLNTNDIQRTTRIGSDRVLIELRGKPI